MADLWRSVQYQWLWHRRHKVDRHNHCHTKQRYFNLAYLNNLCIWKLNETTKRNRYTYCHILLLAGCWYHNWSSLIITFSFSCCQLCMALSRQWLAQTPNRLQIHHRCDKETRSSAREKSKHPLLTADDMVHNGVLLELTRGDETVAVHTLNITEDLYQDFLWLYEPVYIIYKIQSTICAFLKGSSDESGLLLSLILQTEYSISNWTLALTFIARNNKRWYKPRDSHNVKLTRS